MTTFSLLRLHADSIHHTFAIGELRLDGRESALFKIDFNSPRVSITLFYMKAIWL